MYRGRFAPSPTGPLHAGSVVAALASWLDAQAHEGQWLIRIEDVDLPRCPAHYTDFILHQLNQLGLQSALPVIRQSTRFERYALALQTLFERHQVYPCRCSRQRIARHWGPHHSGPRPYPGWCAQQQDEALRHQGHSKAALPLPHHQNHAEGVAWRLRVPHSIVHWVDRRLGPQAQSVAAQVGDFVLRRADGLWAYQLAVVLDDHEQGITHIVRGEDLADNTPRQIVLQQALGYPLPIYWHGPLIRSSDGQKLSKQTGAAPIDLGQPQAILQTLNQAAGVLNLPLVSPLTPNTNLSDALNIWVNAWRSIWRIKPTA